MNSEERVLYGGARGGGKTRRLLAVAAALIGSFAAGNEHGKAAVVREYKPPRFMPSCNAQERAEMKRASRRLRNRYLVVCMEQGEAERKLRWTTRSS